jgi:hypothetical protein
VKVGDTVKVVRVHDEDEDGAFVGLVGEVVECWTSCGVDGYAVEFADGEVRDFFPDELALIEGVSL